MRTPAQEGFGVGGVRVVWTLRVLWQDEECCAGFSRSSMQQCMLAQMHTCPYCVWSGAMCDSPPLPDNAAPSPLLCRDGAGLELGAGGDIKPKRASK